MQKKRGGGGVNVCTERTLCVSGKFDSDAQHWNMFKLTYVFYR